jgi:hypothetical protein
MKKRGYILMGIIVLFVIPFLSADCPPGFVCNNASVNIVIQAGLFCSPDGATWTDFNQNPPLIAPTVGLGNCHKPGAIGEQFCCPVGSECQPTGQMGPLGELYNCVYTDKNFCWKLTTQQECDEYTKWVAVNSIESINGQGYCSVDDNWWLDGSNNICWYEVSCECQWDSVNGCEAIDNKTQVCDNNFIPSVDGICTYTQATWQDNCDVDGFIYASWTATGTGNYAPGGSNEAECQDTGVITIPCENVVKLDFFTWLNVIVVVLILILIYYSYLKVEKKGKKK